LQAHDRCVRGGGCSDARIAVAEHDHQVDCSGQLRRQLEVVALAADPERVPRLRVARRQVVGDQRVLREGDVAVLRQLAQPVRHFEASAAEMVRVGPELRRVDDGLVPQPPELLAEDREVHLGPADVYQQAIAEDEAHAAILGSRTYPN
jgi:hypothetical protein